MQTDHDELKSLIAPYLLGALSADEKRALDAHLRTCDECAREARSLGAGTEMLADQVGPVDLPAGLAERIVAAAQPVEAATGIRARRALARRPARRWAVLGIAAGVALVVAITALTAGLLETRSRLEDSRQALAAVVGHRGGIEMSGGGVAARVVPTREGALLVAAGLRSTPPGKDYELWFIKNGKPVPAGTFESEGEVTIAPVTGSPRKAEGAAVTLEPDGGSKKPTSKPLIQSS